MACRWPTLRYRSSVVTGGGKFDAAGGDKTTDALGNAGVFVDLGPNQGDQIFTGTVAGLTQEFDGYVRRLPAIKSSGVVNAAPPYQVGQGLQPGSYISIFGTDLSDTTSGGKHAIAAACRSGRFRSASTAAGKACRATSTSSVPGQINVQIPWEFQGQSSVQMKVTLYGYLWGSLYTVPLATYSPGIFAVTDGVNNAVISASNPAKRGGSIVIYANGLGPLSTPQSSGDPASIDATRQHHRDAHRDHRGQHGGIHLQRLDAGQRGLVPGERERFPPTRPPGHNP